MVNYGPMILLDIITLSMRLYYASINNEINQVENIKQDEPEEICEVV